MGNRQTIATLEFVNIMNLPMLDFAYGLYGVNFAFTIILMFGIYTLQKQISFSKANEESIGFKTSFLEYLGWFIGVKYSLL